jgi:hypothetical protein
LEKVACLISDLQKECDVLIPLLLPKHSIQNFVFLAFLLVAEGKVHTQLLHPFTTTCIHADECEEQLQQTSQEDPLNHWISSSEFAGYNADFRQGHDNHGAWQGHGRGVAWAQHGMCELARHGLAWSQQGRGMGTAWYV